MNFIDSLTLLFLTLSAVKVSVLLFDLGANWNQSSELPWMPLPRGHQAEMFSGES